MRGRRTTGIDDLFHAFLVGCPSRTHLSPEGKSRPLGVLQNSATGSRRLHHVEVGLLSQRGKGPYPDDYSRAFAFSTIPYPLVRQVALRLPCLHTEVRRQTVGLTTFL